jgi:hypothetical protein
MTNRDYDTASKGGDVSNIFFATLRFIQAIFPPLPVFHILFSFNGKVSPKTMYGEWPA